jgi:hypothetical protein
MLTNIPPEITVFSFSCIGILTGYIWNNQSKRLDVLENKIKNKPCLSVCSHIEAIRVDIDWIKKEFKK